MTDLTTQPLTEAPQPQYIIRTSMGLFFLLWRDFTAQPEMTAAKKEARRLSSDEADFILLKMTRLGIKAKKVEVKS